MLLSRTSQSPTASPGRKRIDPFGSGSNANVQRQEGEDDDRRHHSRRALPRSENFRLAWLLLDDLAGEELLSGLKQGQEFPIPTPEFAPGAAAELSTLLEEQGKWS